MSTTPRNRKIAVIRTEALRELKHEHASGIIIPRTPAEAVWSLSQNSIRAFQKKFQRRRAPLSLRFGDAGAKRRRRKVLVRSTAPPAHRARLEPQHRDDSAMLARLRSNAHRLIGLCGIAPAGSGKLRHVVGASKTPLTEAPGRPCFGEKKTWEEAKCTS